MEEFIERLAAKGYSKRDAKSIIRDVTATITEALAAGETVHFQGFGTFDVRDCAARECRNAHTGEMVHVPETKRPHFTVGATLKRAVREGIVRE